MENPPHKPGYTALSILLCFLFCIPISQAADEEIQVYMDEMDKPGELGLDIHHNYVPIGDKHSPYPGGYPATHLYRFTPEFSYGLTSYLSAGFYLLTAMDSHATPHVDGQKLRLKFIAPYPKNSAFFWGANYEIGHVERRADENPWNQEVKAIIGYRKGKWTFAHNTNIDMTIAAKESGPPQVQLAHKLAYQLRKDFAIGFESYNDLGDMRHLVQHLNQESEITYLVIDKTLPYNMELNLGVGYAYTPGGDRLVIKAITSIPMDKINQVKNHLFQSKAKKPELI